MNYLGAQLGLRISVCLLAALYLGIGVGPAAAQVAGELPDSAPEPATPLPLVPPNFVAAPFAADFVTTGSEGGIPGEHYFPSNGDGTFGARSDIPGLGIVDGTDVADMDGDGDNDFLSCDGTSAAGGEVFLYTNNGGGSFTPSLVAAGITSSVFCTNLRIADFDKDGLNDFVVGDNRNSLAFGTKVYVQGPIGTFTPSATLDTTWTNFGNNLFGVAAGDIDGDGNSDVVMLGYLGIGAGEVRLYSGDGSGGFGLSALLFDIGTDFGASGTTGLGVFDLEGDGDLDIVAGGGFGAAPHFVYTNDGSGNFTPPVGAAFSLNAQTGVDSFDFDGDGDHDLIIVGFGTRDLTFIENLGGSLAPPVVVDANLSGSGIAVGAPELVRVIEVDIDIKFCSNPNAFNCKGRGKMPLTIFGSTTLDVSDIDLDSLQLCEAADLSNCTGAPLSHSVADRGDPSTDLGAAMCAVDPITGEEQDFLNPDGLDDLDVAFDSGEVSAVIGCAGLDRGDVSPTLVLIGQTTGGTPITSIPLDDIGIDQLVVKQASSSAGSLRVPLGGTGPNDPLADRAERRQLRREAREQARSEQKEHMR